MAKKFLALSVVGLASLALSGCTLVPSGQQSGTALDGGIWRSADGGKTFVQANDLLATKGRVLSMSNVDIGALAVDPQDSTALYAASAANGLFFTLDGAASWQQPKGLKQGSIKNIAVDRSNKCVVYATVDNKLYKTENCGRDWNNVYFHQKSQIKLTALATDTQSSMILYLGTSEGEILKSIDGGHAWLTVYRAERDQIKDIIVDHYDSKLIYVGTATKGLFKSLDAGNSWASLGAGLKSYAGSHQYRELIYDSATANSLIFVSKFGLLKSLDGGTSWKIVDLLPAHKTTDILAVAVNPTDSNELYYVTASTLVKTSDGGVTWSSKQLPFKRLTTDIEVVAGTPATVYLASSAATN